MTEYFEIPKIETKQGIDSVLDQVGNYLENPENSKLNNSFGVNEPTAVLQRAAGEIPYHSNEPTQVESKHAKALSEKIAVKILVIVIAMVLSLLIVHMLVKS